MVVITNYHVVQDVLNITVTFIDGNSYEAAVLGSDPYADLEILRRMRHRANTNLLKS